MSIEAIYVLFTWIVMATCNPCYFWDTTLYHDGYCYKMGTNQSNWTDAQAFCGRNFPQARLAEPVTVASLRYLAKTVTLSGEDWWIGGIVASDIPLWSSSRQFIQSGNVSKYCSGICVQLTDSQKDLIIPAMSTNACTEKLKFICQLYVGNPCDDMFPGSNYCNDGNCYKLHNSFVQWEKAVTTCDSQGSKLAEFYFNDTYYYVKNMIHDVAVNHVFLPTNSTVYLESYNTTLYNTSETITFQLLTCGNFKMFLWAEASVASQASPSPIGGSTNEYYVIEYGIAGTIASSFKYCNKTNCITLATAHGADVNCSKYILPMIVYNYEGNFVWVSEAKLWVNFTAIKMTMLKLSRAAVSMENSSAIFVFTDPMSGLDISLGGSDIQHEGLFTWLSTNTTVAINDWLAGEPNDWSTDLGEDNLGWRISSSLMALNDFNGTIRMARPLCQKDVLMATYLIVLPESDSSNNKTQEVHVTSGHIEVVYLHFTQRLNTGETTLSNDWVTSYRNVIFGISSGVELRDTDIYHGIVVLRATNYITVVMYQISDCHIGTTLVFPVNLVSSGYFILTNESQESGSHLTITALENNTDVTIKFPRDQYQPLTVTINGFTIQYISKSSVHLAEFDTAHIQSMDDFSGSFVYSTKPIVVYAGSKSVPTYTKCGDNTLDVMIPVDTLATYYVTTTFGTSSPGSSETYDKFRLLALYDDTVVKITGGSIANVTLVRAGTITDILLSAGSFYVMHSDPYHPFYVTKVTLTSGGACTTSILPDTLWRNRYDLYIKYQQETVVFIVEKNLMSSFLVDGLYNSSYLSSCLDIEGTSLIGCTMILYKGLHHIGFNDSHLQFVAYGSQTFSNGIGYCHALGSLQLVNNSNERFPSVVYINLQDSEPFPPRHLPEATPLKATTESQTTAAQTTESNTAELTTQEQYSTLDSNTTVTALTSTSSQSSTTITTQGSTQSSTLIAQTTTPATTNSMSSNFPQLNISNCLLLKTPQVNLSQQELDLLTRGIENFLLVNIRDTSAFKQKLQSIWDDRPSCHVIGVSGVIIITCFITFFASSDFCNLFRWLFSSESRQKNPSLELKTRNESKNIS